MSSNHDTQLELLDNILAVITSVHGLEFNGLKQNHWGNNSNFFEIPGSDHISHPLA